MSKPMKVSRSHAPDGSAPATTGSHARTGDGRWTVSTRSIGEVLTADIRADELRLLVFALPSEETARLIESRLEALGVSAGTAATGGARQLPVPLGRVADGLASLVTALEAATGRRAGALALYQSPREVACACIGGGDPDVWSHDHPFDAPWVELRDPDVGPEGARGFSLFARTDLDMRIRWPYLLGTPKPEGVIVEARWRAPDGFSVTMRPVSGLDVADDEAPGTFFEGWFSDLEADDDAPDDVAPAAAPAAAPVAPSFPALFEELRASVERDADRGDTDAPNVVPFDAAREVEAGDEEDVLDGDLDAGLDGAFDDETIEDQVPEPALHLIETATVDEAPEVEAEPEPEPEPDELPRHETAEPGLRLVEPAAAVDEILQSWGISARHDSVAAAEDATAGDDDLDTDLEVADRVETPPVLQRPPLTLVRPAAHEPVDAMAPPPATGPEANPYPPEAEPGASVADSGDAEPVAAPDAADDAQRAVRHPDWPAPAVRRKPVAIPGAALIAMAAAAVVAVLFAFGWWLGTRGEQRPLLTGGRAPFVVRVLRAVGLASPVFSLEVRSAPPGAALFVDGRKTPYLTPAVVEVAPGRHRVGLSLPNAGMYTTWVEGRRGVTLPIELSLLGRLHVSSPNPAMPIAVSLDGTARGYAPIEVTDLSPGTHELEFTTRGQPPWSRTIAVPLRGDMYVLAQPFELPPMGVIHVTGTITGDEGVRDLRGATVYVDGERRGATPLDLELPRGPHSLRAEWHGEMLAVQLIDLPGGNERYAAFSFGTGAPPVRLVVQSPTGAIPHNVATTVTVKLQGFEAHDVREMWLHVRDTDGSWKRYAMNVHEADDRDPVGTVVFPVALLDARGETPWYVSVLATTGEEYFTDLRAPRTRPVVRPAAAEIAAPRAGEPEGEPVTAEPSTPSTP